MLIDEPQIDAVLLPELLHRRIAVAAVWALEVRILHQRIFRRLVTAYPRLLRDFRLIGILQRLLERSLLLSKASFADGFVDDLQDLGFMSLKEFNNNFRMILERLLQSVLRDFLRVGVCAEDSKNRDRYKDTRKKHKSPHYVKSL